MPFVDQTVEIEGVTYWPHEQVPVETEADVRGFGVDSNAQTTNGTAVILRDPLTQAVISQPLKSSPQNGFIRSVLASEPAFFYNSDIARVFTVSPVWRDIRGELDDLTARTEAAEAVLSALVALTGGVSIVGRVEALEAFAESVPTSYVQTVAGRVVRHTYLDGTDGDPDEAELQPNDIVEVFG